MAKGFRAIGASNHTDHDREKDDFYATDPVAIRELFWVHDFAYAIREPACGEGHLSSEIELYGKNVKSTDLVYRGYGEKDPVDFLTTDIKWGGDIITNPPYNLAEKFIRKALSIVPEGKQVAMFLKLQFLEGKCREDLFTTYPPKVIYVSRKRIKCALGGNFNVGSSAIAYGWYVWEKGYTGDTTLKWFN